MGSEKTRAHTAVDTTPALRAEVGVGRAQTTVVRGSSPNVTPTQGHDEVLTPATHAGARALRMAHAFPLTWLGVAVLAASLGAFFGYGLPRDDYVVQLVGAAAAGLVVVGLMSAGIAALIVRRSVEPTKAPLDALRLEAERGFALGRFWPRLSWFPLAEVSVEVLEPLGLRVEPADGRERFTALHRTGGEALKRMYTVEDAFGLARFRFRRLERRAVQVSPFLGALERAPNLDALAPGDNRAHPRGKPSGDRVEMRPYVRGDPLRLVLWKVYARTGKVMVRTAERALDEETEVHAYLVASRGDEPSAAVAQLAIARGLLGPRWRFGADGASAGTSDLDEASVAVARSRSARSVSGGGLQTFLSGVRSAGGARIVLFLPCQPGPWVDRVVAACAPFAGRVQAVVGLDGLRDASRRRDWLRTPERADERLEAQPLPEALEEVRSALTRAGMEVMMIDRPTGRADVRGSRSSAA